MTEASARLRKPVLRPPEKHQLGYNSIIVPPDQAVAPPVVAEAATLLKLNQESVEQLLSQDLPLPVARTSSRQEAELVSERLREFGLNCLTLGDEDLGLSFAENAVKRVRAMTFDDASLTIQQAAAEDMQVRWSEVVLILPGRMIENKLEIKERKTRKSENELLDHSEFFRDEMVIDFYVASNLSTWRVSAGGFDFSCLERDKALIANENIGKLQRLLVTRALNAQLDDSYARVRNLLELAWSTEAETQSSGWRRERPGKLSVGMTTTKSNESQFTRYSRLRRYLGQR